MTRVLTKTPRPPAISAACAKNDHSHCFKTNCTCQRFGTWASECHEIRPIFTRFCDTQRADLPKVDLKNWFCSRGAAAAAHVNADADKDEIHITSVRMLKSEMKDNDKMKRSVNLSDRNLLEASFLLFVISMASEVRTLVFPSSDEMPRAAKRQAA